MRKSKTYTYRKRILFVLFLIGALLVAAAPLLAGCEFCWTQGVVEGECLTDLSGGELLTYRNCKGVTRCWVFLGGQLCFPACTGQQCFIV